MYKRLSSLYRIALVVALLSVVGLTGCRKDSTSKPPAAVAPQPEPPPATNAVSPADTVAVTNAPAPDVVDLPPPPPAQRVALPVTNASPVSARSHGMKLGLSTIPLRGIRQQMFTSEQLKTLRPDCVRMGIHWKYREPQPGEYNWEPLDQRTAFLEQHDVSIMALILANGPRWACGEMNTLSCLYAEEAPFRKFVTEMAKRYAGRFDRVQFGNEWHERGWYVGEAEDFVRFANIVYDAFKTHSPTTQVVLGGVSTGAARGLAALQGKIDFFYDEQWRRLEGPHLERLLTSPRADIFKQRVYTVFENARFDMIDVHLYGDAEMWPTYVDAVRALKPDVPVISSEFGGPNASLEPTTDAYQAKRLFAYVSNMEKAGIKEAYFYKLVGGTGLSKNNVASSLCTQDGTPKPSYAVFKAIMDARRALRPLPETAPVATVVTPSE